MVDDEEDILIVLKTYLSNQGYDVRVTLTCDEGLEIFYQFKPDMVLIDVNVGASDGRVMCKTIAKQATYANIPITLMSADRSNLLQFEDHGAKSVLEKPFDLPFVLSTVKNHLT